MRTLWIILKDSLRESFDSRSLQILLGLSCLAVIFSFSISFDERPLEDVLPERLRSLNRIEQRKRMGTSSHTSGSTDDLVIGEPRPAATTDTLPFPIDGTTVVTLETQEVERLDAWITMWRDHKAEKNGSPRSESPTYDFGDREGFLRERLLDAGYSDVFVRIEREASPVRYWIAARAAYPDELIAPSRMHVLFGAASIPIRSSSRAEAVIGLQTTLADAFVGFIGMIILLSVISDFVPNMLRKGTIEPLLARPVRRWQLVLYKYLGGLVFAFCVSGFTFLGCWLGISTSTGYWSPGFLYCTFTAVAIFASLASVAVYMGARTRSSMVAAFSALTVWFMSSTVSQMHDFGAFADNPGVRRAIDTLHVVLPNVKDLDKLNVIFLSNSYLSAPARERLFARFFESAPDWSLAGWTTLAFTVVLIGLAMRHVARRDY